MITGQVAQLEAFCCRGAKGLIVSQVIKVFSFQLIIALCLSVLLRDDIDYSAPLERRATERDSNCNMLFFLNKNISPGPLMTKHNIKSDLFINISKLIIIKLGDDSTLHIAYRSQNILEIKIFKNQLHYYQQ